MNKSDFGIIGLGTMGKNISLNVAEKGFYLSVFNRTDEGEENVVNQFLESNKSFGNISGFIILEDFVESLKKPRIILLMVRAGEPIDDLIDKLTPIISEHDIIIDGGNSHYQDTKRRFDLLAKNNISFIGCGISGGEEGARFGPSIMPGGDKSSYDVVAPILKSISAKDKSGKPCCAYIGTEGAGHFIKMVHNGIEYAEMQLLAELYALMSTSMNNEEIANEFLNWNENGSDNYLLQITVDILKKKEDKEYLLDIIQDKAQNKGTGAWSSDVALNLGQPSTMMTSAVFARYLSSFKDKRVEYSKILNKDNDPATFVDLTALNKAYHFARIINHHQGFCLIKQASDTYNWHLNLSKIARIWSNGCIIRSEFMTKLVSLFKSHEEILDDKHIFQFLKDNEIFTLRTIQNAISSRVSFDNFWSAYNYWISITTENLPANLIQAQRDYFGAHSYLRKDDPSNQLYHTNWRDND